MSEGLDLMTSKTVAQRLHLSEATLRSWRHKRFGPPGVKVGRQYLYRPKDVEAWLRAQEEAQTPRPR